MVRGWAGDNLMFCWNLWWVATAVWEDGSAGLRCPLVFAPDGMSFVFHTHTWLYGLLWAAAQTPWRLVPGLGDPPSPVLAYNVLSLASTMLTGAAAAALVRACGIRTMAGAVLAGLTVAFCGLRQLAMFGHLNFMGTEFFVASVAAHTVAMQGSGRWKWWAAGGALAGAAFLNDQTLGVFSGYFLAAAGCYALVTGAGSPARKALAGPALSAGVMMLVSGPHLVELARVWRSADYVVLRADDARSADLLNIFLPGRLSTPLGGAMSRLREAAGIAGGDGAAYVGLHAWMAGVWGAVLWRRPRAWPALARFWVAVGAAGLLLTLGGTLVVAGRALGPLPAALLQWLPGLNNLRIPERHSVFVVLALAVGSAAVASRLATASWRSRAAFYGSWVVLFAIGSLPRMDAYLDTGEAPVALSPALLAHGRCATIRADARSVWDIPGDFSRRESLWWQTQHRRPLVFGSSARVSPALVAGLHSRYPFLRGLVPGASPGIAPAQRFAGGPEALDAQVRDFVASRRVGFVLVRKAAMPDGPEFVARHVHGAQRLYEDKWFVLFRTASDMPSKEFTTTP
jgi:hypothetical protein